jgi:hypothetical protein
VHLHLKLGRPGFAEVEANNDCGGKGIVSLFSDLADITEFLVQEQKMRTATREGWVLEYEC